MGAARLAVYLIGLALVVVAAWWFLTQTPLGGVIPGGVAFALILLLLGIGVMAGARSLNDARSTRRVIHDGPAPPVAPAYGGRYVEEPVAPRETVVEERRYD